MTEQRFRELVAKFEIESLWLLEKSLGFSDEDAWDMHLKAAKDYIKTGKPAWKAFKADYYMKLSHTLQMEAGVSKEDVDGLIAKLEKIR